jgi:hypothetical protein
VPPGADPLPALRHCARRPAGPRRTRLRRRQAFARPEDAVLERREVARLALLSETLGIAIAVAALDPRALPCGPRPSATIASRPHHDGGFEHLA